MTNHSPIIGSLESDKGFNLFFPPGPITIPDGQTEPNDGPKSVMPLKNKPPRNRNIKPNSYKVDTECNSYEQDLHVWYKIYIIYMYIKIYFTSCYRLVII